MTTTFDQATMKHIEAELIDLVDKQIALGNKAEVLGALASVLQMGLLSGDVRALIPASYALDPLMRAVKHTIIDPTDTRYIESKLEQGYRELTSELKRSPDPEDEVAPRFAGTNVVELATHR